MKKLKTLFLVVALTFVFMFSLKSVNAEEETSSSATTETDEVQKESDLQTWLNENLGWLIGVPAGTVLSILAEGIFLFAKGKKKDEEIAETKESNKNSKEVIETANNLLNNTRELANTLSVSVTSTLNDVKALASSVDESVAAALKRIDLTDKNLTNVVTVLEKEIKNVVKTSLEALNTTVVNLEVRLATLEKVQEMIALHTKELVANGTAEEISKKLRG